VALRYPNISIRPTIGWSLSDFAKMFAMRKPEWIRYETAVMCLLVMTDNDCGSYRYKAAKFSSVGLYTVTADSPIQYDSLLRRHSSSHCRSRLIWILIPCSLNPEAKPNSIMLKFLTVNLPLLCNLLLVFARPRTLLCILFLCLVPSLWWYDTIR